MSRIPPCNVTDYQSMVDWFQKLADADLLFHPEDDPATIIRGIEGQRTFTDEEADELREHIAMLNETFGERVCGAALQVLRGGNE